uniref:Byssal protein-1 n=1 Tax=Mytilus coruscus TaxID=42192 RepID=A0A0G2YQ77_MYTCO|nr:byssal protein-1 [Mytilus coruscus]
MRLHITLRLVIFVIYVQSVTPGGRPPAPPTPAPTTVYTDSTTNPPTTPTPTPVPTPAPTPAPNRACTRPKQIHIQELVDARKSGRYPKAAIRTAMFRSRRKNRHLLHFTRYNGHGFCETYRHKTTAAISVDTPVSSRNIPLWLNTCPTYTKYFYFPRTIVYNRQTCWMLSPWHSLRCPYAVCMSRGCQGVKASNQGISACRQTKWRSLYYYIWCSKFGLVQRYIRLPQCCSCMRLRCP